MDRKSRFFVSGLVVITMILMISCDPARKAEKEEEEMIQQYLRDNYITISPTASGLYYIPITEGTGAYPVANDSVSVLYEGTFLNGTVFDSNLETEPIGFYLGTYEVIPGFEEGILLMKEGGKARLLMPSSLAYGSQGTYWGIGGYTPLIFEVELIDIIPPSEK